MAFERRKRRVKHFLHLGPRLEPPRDLDRGGLMFSQAEPHGPQPSQREKDIFWSGTDCHGVEGFAEFWKMSCIRRDEAEQQIGMAAEIFGAGFDGDIDAALV